MKKRIASVKRETKETAIELRLQLEGKGNSELDTGVPFIEHMLSLMTKHGFFNLNIKAKGDIEIDFHHLVEDLGLCLGQAFNEAVGDKIGLKRYGNMILPMDDVLLLVAVDFSGRPFLSLDLPFEGEKVGNFDLELVEEFLRALSNSAAINIHAKLLSGKNKHHIVEALFKALGKALDQATSFDERGKGLLPSTKGAL